MILIGSLERELATMFGLASCLGDEERIEEACAELAELRSIQRERDMFLKGEYICKRCGLRNDAGRSNDHEF